MQRRQLRNEWGSVRLQLLPLIPLLPLLDSVLTFGLFLRSTLSKADKPVVPKSYIYHGVMYLEASPLEMSC